MTILTRALAVTQDLNTESSTTSSLTDSDKAQKAAAHIALEACNTEGSTKDMSPPHLHTTAMYYVIRQLFVTVN